jgi:hypothetical protein
MIWRLKASVGISAWLISEICQSRIVPNPQPRRRERPMLAHVSIGVRDIDPKIAEHHG